MTPLPDAVRRACDAAWTQSKCVWPDCSCLFDGSGEAFLTALLAAARAEEREACAKVAETRHELWRMPHPDDAGPFEVCDDESACRDIAAAIRARAQGDAK